MVKEGIFPADSSHVTALVNTNLKKIFKDYPLSDENFDILKLKYISNLRRIVDLQTRTKRRSDTNTVIELTAAPADFDSINNAASSDEGLKELAAVLNELRAQGFTDEDLKADKKFQKTAYKKFGKFLESLSAGERQSIDITCEVVHGEDGQKYWVPEQRAILAKFFNVPSIYEAYGAGNYTPPPVAIPNNTEIEIPVTTEPEITEPLMPVTTTTSYSVNDKWLIYWYVCGTDLEPKEWQASTDIREVVAANISNPNVKVLLQTGGSPVWQNNAFPNNAIGRYIYDSSSRDFRELGTFPNASMGDAATLESFLKYGRDNIERNFAPNHRILIFWDHGGLAIVCRDDIFGKDRLDMNEMSQAFENVYPNASQENPPFEIIGFDACLRATYDNANNISKFANYMVASTAIESGYGWYYTDWINALSRNAAMNGKDLGEIICRTSYEDCNRQSQKWGSMATFSTIDLSKMNQLRTAYENFANEAISASKRNPSAFYSNFARVADNAGKYSNLMVDLKGLAAGSENILPQSSSALKQAIDAAVVVNIHGDRAWKSSGLSNYYPFQTYKSWFNVYDSQNAVPKNMKNLYRELVYNFPHLVVNAQVSMDDEENARSAGNAPDIFNVQALQNFPVNIDEDEDKVWIKLTREQMDGLRSVRCLLAAGIDEDEDENTISDELNGGGIVFLGTDANVKSDWNSGLFQDNFNAKWAMLNGRHILMEVSEIQNPVRDSNVKLINGGYIMYDAAILLNDEPMILKISYSYADGKYQIIGAQNEIDETGMARRGFVELKKGDKITPIFLALTLPGDTDNPDLVLGTIHAAESGDMVLKFIKGYSFVLNDDNPVIEDKTLKDGDYGYRFQFVDPIGKAALSSPALFDVYKGKVLFADKPDEVSETVTVTTHNGEEHVIIP